MSTESLILSSILVAIPVFISYKDKLDLEKEENNDDHEAKEENHENHEDKENEVASTIDMIIE